MYCDIDDMIFYSYKSSSKPTPRDIKNMKNAMRSGCSLECPKIWKHYPGEDETLNYEDFLYDQMSLDEGAYIPEFDEDFKFSNPPF